MKNRIMVLAFVLCSVPPVNAQTVREWTQQKKTQLEYLVKQVAALRSYAEVAAKGYAIAREGLTAIQKIKQGDLTLHEGYITSLKKVNPVIGSYWKVAATITLQSQIVARCTKQRILMQNTETFTTLQKKFYSSIITNMLTGCETLIDELVGIMGDDWLQLKDDERLKRIDTLYGAMQDRYVLLQHFCAEVNSLGSGQKYEKAGVKSLRSLYSVY